MMFCAKFGWNWPSGSGEEDENVKSLQTDWQTDRQTTDDRWSEKLTYCRHAEEKEKKSLDTKSKREEPAQSRIHSASVTVDWKVCTSV